MIKTGPGLISYFIVLSLVVAAGIAYGLLGEQLGMRTVYHSQRILQDHPASRCPLPLCERVAPRRRKLQDVVSVNWAVKPLQGGSPSASTSKCDPPWLCLLRPQKI